MEKSWAAYVHTAGDPPDGWATNGLRFGTKVECDQYGLDLAMRWTAVEDVKSRESDDAITHWITSAGHMMRVD
jgi:hypothetical protein